ncbi:MAG: hypothetical protein ACK5Q6_16005 [Cyanobacteriota bacterium]
MRSELALKFLDQWALIMGDGITAKGTTNIIKDWDDYQAISWNKNKLISSDQRVRGHRHDQSAAGIVAHRLGMLPYSDYLKDIHYKVKPIKRNTIILHHREFSETITSLKDIYYQVFLRLRLLKFPAPMFANLFVMRRASEATINSASLQLKSTTIIIL